MVAGGAEVQDEPSNKTLWRGLVIAWLVLIALDVAGWLVYGYEAGDWSMVVLALGSICLAMHRLHKKYERVWLGLALAGVVAGASSLFLEIVSLFRWM